MGQASRSGRLHVAKRTVQPEGERSIRQRGGTTTELLFNFFLEVDYRPASDWILHASTLVTYDFIYPIKSDDDTWNEKQFNQSTDLRLDDEYWQLLKEFHVTWAPEGISFPTRKTDRVLGGDGLFSGHRPDQPGRRASWLLGRGVQTSVIPVWLWRAEYWPNVQTGWLEELGFQFVLNPNADWIPNLGPSLGNTAGGIWAPAEELPNPLAPYGPPFSDTTYLGASTDLIPEPDEWDDDYFDFTLRVSMMIHGHILTLNGFYGMEKTPRRCFLALRPIHGLPDLRNSTGWNHDPLPDLRRILPAQEVRWGDLDRGPALVDQCAGRREPGDPIRRPLAVRQGLY